MMLCEEAKCVPAGSWHVQVKLDGVRALVGDTITNRHGSVIAHRFPELPLAKDCVLDGEVVVLDAKGNSDFEKLQLREHKENKLAIMLASKQNPATFIAFDIIKYQGKPCTMLPIEQRRVLLNAACKEHGITMLPSVMLTDEALAQHVNALRAQGGKEGVVFKLPGSEYEFARSKNWIKMKFKLEKDIVVNSYETSTAGITVTDGTHRVAINGAQHKPVKTSIDETGTATITIEFLNKTRSGMYRQPVYKKMVSSE